MSAAVLCVAIVGPGLVGRDGLALDPAHELMAPALVGRLGTADNGVDLLTALVWGARLSLSVALLATALSTLVGTSVGVLSGLLRGKADALALRVMDVVLALPSLVLAIYLAALLSPSVLSVVIALSATGWVSCARIVRTRTKEALARDHVTAARALGAAPLAVVVHHVLPHVLPIVWVQASAMLGANVLAEASLGFLGLGPPAGTPSWGALVDEGCAYLFVAPHIALCAGGAVFVAAFGFMLLGDGLQHHLEPARARK